MAKNHTSSVNIVPWEKIEQRYSDNKPLFSLIKFIRNNGYDQRLYGYTSLDRLVITIYNPAESHKDSLIVRFDKLSQKWHFEYHSKPFEPVEAEDFILKNRASRNFASLSNG